MIHQRVVVLLRHYAYVADSRIDHIGKLKINGPVSPPYGQRPQSPLGRQLNQIHILLACINQAKNIV